MTLKQLEAFYWAATCANFAMAAGRIHVTTSSLSKRVAELEASIGQPLFDRSGHRAALTAAGERLLPLAVDLLRQAEHVRTVTGGTTGLQGICRLGAGELASITWLPLWVAALRKAHPELMVEVVVDIGAGLAGRLERGELDVAVIAGRTARPALRCTPLAKASFVWCAQPRLAAGIQSLDAKVWRGQTLVTLPRGSGVTSILDDWMERAGAQPQRTLPCNQWGAIAGLIVAGQGIGMLPMGLAEGLRQRRLLGTLASKHKLRMLDYSFHFRHDDPRPLVPEMQRICMSVADFDARGPFF
jgi:DNA-binding transcriptional LysR family regulator